MLQLTRTAAMALDEVRRQQQIPADYGVRLSGSPTPEGELGLQITFAEAPADTDEVDEQFGTKVFVAQEVVEPLSDVVLDATTAVSSDGEGPAQLLLRRRGEDE